MSTFLASGQALFLLCVIVFIPTISSLICYECKDCSLTDCACEKTVKVDNKYCVIEQETIGLDTNVYLQAVGRNVTLYYVTDPFYISVTETIRFDETTKKWVTNLDKTSFGCQTDKCNRPDLIQALPKSILSLSLPEKWLDENIRRKPGANSTSCHHCADDVVCGDTQYFVDMSRCAEKQCAGFCVVTDKFANPNSTEFCYQSECIDDPSAGDPHSIIITAIYYLTNTNFDIWQIDIFCQADNCTRLEIFEDIKVDLKKEFNATAFYPKNNSVSLRSISILFLIPFLIFVNRF